MASLILKKLLFLTAFGAFAFEASLVSAAAPTGGLRSKFSAYRKPGVSYVEYLKNVPDDAWEVLQDSSEQNGERTPYYNLDQAPMYVRGKRTSAKSKAVLFAKLDTSVMIQWKSEEQVKEAFEKIRDTRFLDPESVPKFLRRSSWLYPMDGCFARAGLAVKNLMDWKFPTVYKLFVFGDLTVDTLNSPMGQVTWWFHVVPAVKLKDEVYVLDPAIEAHRPLLLKNWLETMTVDVKSLKLSICDGQTYTPADSCLAPPKDPLDDWGRFDQMEYLELEWENLLKLRRSPEKELGDNPPWLEPTDVNSFSRHMVINSKSVFVNSAYREF